jgi:chorismate mutase / prephenate dehydratase
LSSELTGAGLKAETMVLIRDQGTANVLVEVEGSLADDDERLTHLGSVLRRPVVLGGYAVPIAGGDR